MAHRQSLVPAKTKYDSAVAYYVSQNKKHYTPEEFSDDDILTMMMISLLRAPYTIHSTLPRKAKKEK
jgi:hypothetical protein